MHSAPSVSYPVGAVRGLQFLLLGLCALSLGGIVLWAAQSHRPGWPQALGLLAWAIASALAWQGWRSVPTGRIHWNGSHWAWERPASDVPGQITVHFDAQSLMLLRWQAAVPAGAVWLWAGRAASPGQWTALRRAVYSRPAAPADALAGPA